MTPDATGQQDLRAYLRIFWRWKFLFLTILIVIPVAAYVIASGKKPSYQSSTLVELQDITVGLGASSAPIQTGNLAAVARLVDTTPVAAEAAPFLNPRPADPASLLGSVSATANTQTGFLTITGTSHTPAGAADIANAFAKALSVHQTTQAKQAIEQQIATAKQQLKATHKSDPADRASLTQQISQLEALIGSTGSGAQVIQAATPNATPIGPGTRRTVELAILIALLLGAGAVLVAESGDRRLRTPEDLERIVEWPLLAAVPRTAFSPEKAPHPADDEAFQMLRASLTYFNVDQPIASVAVISPLAEDGKTTVATGLARALSRAGKHVILLDGDLRRPQAAQRLGIHAEQGLGAVLAGELDLEQALVELDEPDAPGVGKLEVLPAGPPPPNPVALISSQRMNSVLKQLEERADLVIIDTAAALAISDSIPLLQAASGVIMIVRMNRSASAAVRRMKKVVTSANATVLGVVATGAEPAGGYGGYADRYYARNGNGNGNGDGHGRGPEALRRLRRRRPVAVDNEH
jgi:capsular exopolysaccharide synthesis family protein